MNRHIATAIKITLAIVTILVILLIAIISYLWPVVDRLYVRPCHYYPHTFTDCRSANNGQQ